MAKLLYKDLIFVCMLKNRWKPQLQVLSLCLLAFAVPMPYIFSSVATIVLVLVFLLTLNLKEIFTNLKEKKIILLWTLFYTLHLISYFYSANRDESLFDLQVKLPFLVFPLIIGAWQLPGRQSIERILIFFSFGVSAVSVFCLARAARLWTESRDTSVFFYHKLVDGFDANAVYMAWYVLFSLSILIFLQWRHSFRRIQGLARGVFLIANAVFFFLLSSKTLIVIFLVLVIPLYLFSVLRRLSYIRIGLISLAFLVLVTGLVATDNPIRKRYEEVLSKDISSSLTRDYHGVDQNEFNNLTLRIFLWRLAWENMNDCNLWLAGCGNGDIKDRQFIKMVEYDVKDILKDHFWYKPVFAKAHLHNMYLQSLVMLGLPGLATFCAIIFIPFLITHRSELTYVFLPFFTSSAMFMMQESALQTQAGTIFYTFFSCVFLNIYYSNSESKTQVS